jgi:hypothetical protein
MKKLSLWILPLILYSCGGGPETRTGEATDAATGDNFSLTMTATAPYDTGTLVVRNAAGQVVLEATIQRDPNFKGQGLIKQNGQTIGGITENPDGTYGFDLLNPDPGQPDAGTATVNDG